MQNKIVIIEDDIFLGKVYQAKLQQTGFDTLILTNGVDALRRVKEFKPSVVLLDIIMPDRNGFEVIKDIKSDKDISGLPIIVLTRLAAEEDKKKCLDLGANEFISKTDITFEDVFGVIKKYVP